MEIKQLVPAEVVRDDCGFWVHPEVIQYLCQVIGDRESMTKQEHEELITHFNINLQRVEMEWDCPEELSDKYWGDGDTDVVKDWQPTPPNGNGWFLVSVNDTEDGPVAWWAKSREIAE